MKKILTVILCLGVMISYSQEVKSTEIVLNGDSSQTVLLGHTTEYIKINMPYISVKTSVPRFSGTYEIIGSVKLEGGGFIVTTIRDDGERVNMILGHGFIEILQGFDYYLRIRIFTNN